MGAKSPFVWETRIPQTLMAEHNLFLLKWSFWDIAIAHNSDPPKNQVPTIFMFWSPEMEQPTGLPKCDGWCFWPARLSHFHPYQTGWWFGSFFIFPYIGNNHPNWIIFFRGVQTTNQQMFPFLWFGDRYIKIKSSQIRSKLDINYWPTLFFVS